MDERTRFYSRLMFEVATRRRKPGDKLSGANLKPRGLQRWIVRQRWEKVYDYLLRRWEREGGKL